MAKTPEIAAQPHPANELGALSAKYETSGRGPGTVSGGRGDAGGISYGSYQLASKLGRPEAFLAREGATWSAEFGHARSGSPAFSKIWKAIARREPAKFHAAQHAYIKRTHYDVQIAHVANNTGANLDRRSDAVRDAVWSTAVQHGPSNSLVVRAMNGGHPNDRDLIIAIYAERGRRSADGNLVHFRRNSRAVQAGVAARFHAELKDALAMLDAISA